MFMSTAFAFGLCCFALYYSCICASIMHSITELVNMSDFVSQWAFGVTCWEIFTCGRVPYVGVPPMTLLSQLHNGYRLDRPTNATCSDEM